MKERMLKLCFLLFTSCSFSRAFLEHPDETLHFEDAGHCVMYGECDAGWNRGKLNCPATDANRHPPRLTDPAALKFLKNYCPDLYKGDNSTYTCCAPSQLRSMEKSMSVPQQLLASCPACFYNFLNQICQMTCSPYQSKFLWANMSAQYPLASPSMNHSGIPSLTYVMTDRYAQGLYDSCKNVHTYGNIPALGLMCGRTLETCSPQKWLQYMGNTGNGQAPFPINYLFRNKDWTSPDGEQLDPLNITNIKCSESVPITTSVLKSGKCLRFDCSGHSDPLPSPTAETRKKYFDDMFGAGNYKSVELIIKRIDNTSWIKHSLPPPSVGDKMFAPEFGKDFLHQVLELQGQIRSLVADDHGQTVTLNDVCKKLPNQQTCVVESVLQYYQNNASKVDEITMDEYGFFVLADYLDHFLACSVNPTAVIDRTALNMSCGSDFGNITQPYIVLNGYQDAAFQNATGLVITFILKNDKAASEWQQKFDQFMKNYSNSNMSIAYMPKSSTQEDKQLNTKVVEQTAHPGPGYDIVLDDDVAADDDATADDDDEGHCTWYGQCGQGWNQGLLNCPTNKTTRNSPLLKDPEGLQILKKYCPSLYNGPNNTRTCCSTGQLKTLQGNLGLPDQLLSRCPACYSNFLNQICQMTCSPVQSKFLYANMTCPPDHPGGSQCDGIPSVTYIMTEKFAHDLYYSCKDVQMPSANDKAMSVFCGRKAKDCSPKIWLSYMGNTGNGRAPFPINYIYTSDPWVKDNQTYIPLNMTNIGCNETISNTSLPCSCQDCQASCAPVPPPPAKKKPFKILGIDGPAFIMSCCFLAFVIFFGTYVICYNIVKRNSLAVRNQKDTYQSSESIEQDCCDDYSINGSQHNLLNQVSPADIGGLEKLGSKVEDGLKKIFTSWGTLCAKNPLIVLLVSVIVFGSLAGGIARYDVTTDPVKLWSSKQSTAREQKDYFDSHFGPFYRTQQIIISRPNNHTRVKHDFPPPSVESVMFTSLFEKDFMHQILDLQLDIQNMEVPYKNGTISLQDICFKPLSPDNDQCTVESVLQYWQNNRTNLDKVFMDKYGFFVLADYLSHFLKCAEAPASVSDTTKLDMSCLGAYGGPAFPWVVLGGYDGMNYLNATAFVITFVVNNHLDEKENAMAEAWEAEFIKYMKSYNNTNMTISFSAQRSIQDELDRESSSDIWTILVSYLIMFVYITIALGQFHDFDTILVDSKVTLGMSGVTIVLLSVAASVGFYSYCSVPMTLIIIEVVPFLVLAVGVDNIFILVQTYQRDVRKPSETLEEQIGRVLGTVGPSMLLTSFSESVAFFLGALTDMPAVREFALYAAMAVLFDFILQITCFVSLMTIDAKRQESNRFDICFCVTIPKKEKQEKSDGFLYWLVNNYYSHAVLTQWMRPIIILVFVGWFFASIALACHLELGLDQSLSMPTDSYVLDYFKNITAYLSVGAPIYFVVPSGYNYMSKAGQDAVCGSKGCLQDSLIGQVFRSSQISNYTYIAQPAGSWIDDYFDWINSAGDPPCCRLNATGGFCPSTSDDNCTACPFQPEINGRPTPHDFIKYLPMYLVDNPGLKCAKGGHAAYGAGVNLIKDKTKVGATYFMTYHTTLKTSADYINALKEARSIAKNISISMNITDEDQQVFPYSIFYVFYEQYLFIVHQTMMNIGICMAAIFVATFILLGFDIMSAIAVCITILMIVVDIMGMMYLWDISLNALSLVNLVMAIGIAVEFCSHIARAFAVSLQPTKVLRAKDALAHMGSSVLSGITLTKLGGIIVLAFAKSQLFQVFYFRMYLGMVVFGATHGLMFLPVFLSYCGPGINKAKLYRHQQEQNKEASSKLRNSSHDAPPHDRFRHIEDNPPSYTPDSARL